MFVMKRKLEILLLGYLEKKFGEQISIQKSINNSRGSMELDLFAKKMLNQRNADFARIMRLKNMFFFTMFLLDYLSHVAAFLPLLVFKRSVTFESPTARNITKMFI